MQNVSPYEKWHNFRKTLCIVSIYVHNELGHYMQTNDCLHIKDRAQNLQKLSTHTFIEIENMMQQYKQIEFHGLRVCIVWGFSVIQSKIWIWIWCFLGCTSNKSLQPGNWAKAWTRRLGVSMCCFNVLMHIKMKTRLHIQ